MEFFDVVDKNRNKLNYKKARGESLQDNEYNMGAEMWIINNNKLLMTQRSVQKTHSGGWEVPGGCCQAGETTEDTIKREMKEEIGIKFEQDELGFHEYDLVQILNTLSEKNLIEFNGSSVKLTISDKEINAVKSKKDVEKIELNIKEKESYNLIKELVDDKNLVSKYTLEGHLLYGDLKLSNFKMYHIILSLENKNLLKPIKKEDGDYYLLVE